MTMILCVGSHEQPLTHTQAATHQHKPTFKDSWDWEGDEEAEENELKRNFENWFEKKNSVLTNHDVVDREGRNNTGYNL